MERSEIRDRAIHRQCRSRVSLRSTRATKLLSSKEAPMNHRGSPSRRHMIVTGACAGLLLPIRDALAQDLSPDLSPTPACHDGDAPTLPQVTGPFFKPKSPRRSDLREGGIAGRPVELSGVVLTRACRPVANALGDLWHAYADGEYDNKAFRLRGHIFTDAQGR